MDTKITPDAIMQIGMGFWSAKTLLVAVELGLFTLLDSSPLDAQTLAGRLGIHPRSARDFFDALVALGLLERHNEQYSNTQETERFLVRGKLEYIGGFLEMANARLYPFWGSLTQGLQTGQPQNEAKNGENFFTALYADAERLETFLKSMTGLSIEAAKAIAAKFPWSEYKTFIDIGTAQGGLPVQVALAHPHLSGGGFDLPVVRPVFEEYVNSNGLSQRLQFFAGNFFSDSLPVADVLVMGHILHDWNLDEKLMLLTKAYEALPSGGALIVYDAIIDDNRCENAFGLLMSLNMLIETSGGFDYTGADCIEWMRSVGFRELQQQHLTGSESMIFGIK
ncbi:methyltransferase [Komarekiella sp. 'clone 1']|uniref:Methyltransferase n=1 Tax=Komarekiella delphini-convector SJRDD-AB1 TaxID=2593771 RepID=A0AA40T079_9NOST|nr:methyltransferase [Komarekiella delphini-convector]MBD6618558.1 methyltransferase [Komarekiella delphini-convector SJRDD-AB1]